MEEEIKRLKEDVKKMSPLIAHNNDRIKLLESEKAQLQKQRGKVEQEES
jgi:hypothetical protein